MHKFSFLIDEVTITIRQGKKVTLTFGKTKVFSKIWKDFQELIFVIKTNQHRFIKYNGMTLWVDRYCIGTFDDECFQIDEIAYEDVIRQKGVRKISL